MTIGDRIKAAREAAGLAQTELAQRIGVARQTIYQIERGQIRFSTVDRLYQLAQTMGVKMEDLIGKPELERKTR